MRKREFELFSKELLDVRALYVVCLFDLYYFEDLRKDLAVVCGDKRPMHIHG